MLGELEPVSSELGALVELGARISPDEDAGRGLDASSLEGLVDPATEGGRGSLVLSHSSTLSGSRAPAPGSIVLSIARGLVVVHWWLQSR
jgi:hypothetical protein